ncbi:hypothetical protein KMZ32_06465 [Phycicoccus sp. MAQZ13P-2]|uniref:hypothetical protein n=1 Tax=Phycicoccus mangrovi TaxID=2840470 RepID=UPI001C0052A1|nr:hypothetical protein [Phycicoccus mangrovi]MBT9273713.1 hypothetical protein [Phycicoccus mangrovi]
MIRSAAGLDRLQLFLVSAVLCLAATRAFLTATGFPQIGGDGLHVAHVLWGGLGMLVGQLLSLMFIGPRAVRLAAVVSGVGFGLFIDEVGKFVTKDHDYFFEPVAAIIYGTLVLTWLLVRVGIYRRPLTNHEHMVNRLDAVTAGAAISSPDPAPTGKEQKPRPRAGSMLSSARTDLAWSWLGRIRTWLDRRLSVGPVLTVTAAFALFAIGRPVVLLTRHPTVGNWVYLLAVSLSLLLTVAGLAWCRAGRRTQGLQMVAAALVVSLLPGQFFWLLDNEFAGFFLVSLNVFLVVRVRALGGSSTVDRATNGRRERASAPGQRPK